MTAYLPGSFAAMVPPSAWIIWLQGWGPRMERVPASEAQTCMTSDGTSVPVPSISDFQFSHL